MEKSLAVRFKAYEEGTGDMPVIHTKATFQITEKGHMATLSEQIEDRMGEIVILKGLEIIHPERGIIMLDQHAMQDSVVDNVMGRIRNIKISNKDGTIKLRGELDFAPTPRAQIGKMLVDGGYVDSLSIGFGVKKYDPETREILEGELYECSIVSVPANTGALIDSVKDLKELEEKTIEEVSKIEKKLKRYDEIKPAFKEFSKLFLSNNFCKEIGYEKTDSMILDINKIHELILNKLKNTPQVEAPQEKKVEAPQNQASEHKRMNVEEIKDILHELIYS